MLNKKICLIGAFCVGKTALIQRYVYSIFSERYLSTLGVKISKKQITVDGVELTMVIWDLEGKDDYAVSIFPIFVAPWDFLWWQMEQGLRPWRQP